MVKRPWVTFFSQTGAEIADIAESLDRWPDVIITNKRPDHLRTIDSRLEGKVTFVPNRPSEDDYFKITKSLRHPIMTLHGWLRVVPAEFIERYSHSIFNGHPGLITKYPELKGKDPYSASKSCSEIIAYSYSKSYENMRIATVRSGNVIGGGDWSDNRIIPDIVKSIKKNKQIIIRNPKSTRPWLYVLDVCKGYIDVAIKLDESETSSLLTYNLAPTNRLSINVERIAKEFSSYLKYERLLIENKINQKKESNVLNLNCRKAVKELSWKNYFNFNSSINETAKWYVSFLNNADSLKITENQVKNFIFKLKELIHLFEVEKIQKGGARFDFDKARWINHKFLANSDSKLILERFPSFFNVVGANVSEKRKLAIYGLLKERLFLLEDFKSEASLFFSDPVSYDEKVIKKIQDRKPKKVLNFIIQILEKNIPASNWKKQLQSWGEKEELPFSVIMQSLRLAIVGNLSGPDILVVCGLLEKEVILKRLKKLINYLNN